MKKKIFFSIGIIFLIIIGLIFFQGKKDKWICKDGLWTRIGSPKFSQPTTPCTGKRKDQELPSIPPDSTVVSFYNLLLKEDNIVTNEAYKNSPYLTDSVKQKINPEVGETQLFFCSDEQPKSYKITQSSTNQTKATVTIEETFEAQKVMVPISLQAVEKQWKITEIKCAK